MGGLFGKLSGAAAGAWPVLRILLGLAALALAGQAVRSGALQHREGLALAAGERRALASRVDSLDREIRQIRMEAMTFYDCGDLGYQRVRRLMKSRRFTAAFEAWALEGRKKERVQK